MPTQNIAVKFPLEINDSDGATFVVYDASQLQQVVSQNIKMVLLTTPGERIFNNNFGVGMRRYLFLMPSEIINGIPGDKRFPPLRQYIITQLNSYIPFISIRDLDLQIQEKTISVSFKYYINNSSTAFTFNLSISEL